MSVKVPVPLQFAHALIWRQCIYNQEETKEKACVKYLPLLGIPRLSLYNLSGFFQGSRHHTFWEMDTQSYTRSGGVG